MYLPAQLRLGVCRSLQSIRNLENPPFSSADCILQHCRLTIQQQAYGDVGDVCRHREHHKVPYINIQDRQDSLEKTRKQHLVFHYLARRNCLKLFTSTHVYQCITIFQLCLIMKYIKYLHDPNEAANKSLYALFQHNPVISSFFAFSNENFHKGKRVPSVSRNSSEASSQYLKSKEKHN